MEEELKDLRKLKDHVSEILGIKYYSESKFLADLNDIAKTVEKGAEKINQLEDDLELLEMEKEELEDIISKLKKPKDVDIDRQLFYLHEKEIKDLEYPKVFDKHTRLTSKGPSSWKESLQLCTKMFKDELEIVSYRYDGVEVKHEYFISGLAVDKNTAIKQFRK